MGKSVEEVKSFSYEEFRGWINFFDKHPIGWREDNRAAIIACSSGFTKAKPEDLFDSLARLKKAEYEAKQQKNFAQKFMERFGDRITEKGAWK